LTGKERNLPLHLQIAKFGLQFASRDAASASLGGAIASGQRPKLQ
jgi:hypothetical protein